MSLTRAPIRHPAARIGAWSRRRLALTLCILGLSLNSVAVLAQPESDRGHRDDVTAPALLLLMPEAIGTLRTARQRRFGETMLTFMTNQPPAGP